MKKLFILIIVIALLLPTFNVVAAKQSCKVLYRVGARDTLRSIAALYKMDPWWIIKANPAQAEPPNRPIYLGSSLCIPEDISGKPKKLAAYILDQSPADFFPRLVGKDIVIKAYNFGRGSIWLVKVDGTKVKGTFKATSKSVTTKAYRSPSGKQVCLKNIRTDFLLCRKLILPIP